MTAVAVIVVNHNGGPTLDRCLRSVLGQQPPPDEVVVVDNDSSDGSVASLPEGVDLLRMPRNDGFGAGVNAGLRATRAPFVMSLNPDTTLEPGCLAAATAVLDADRELGSVAPRVLMAADPGRIDAIGIGLTSRLGQINHAHGLPATQLEERPRRLLGPLGGAALWRRHALEQAGGFHEGWFLYWEDVDLALRLNRSGYACETVPAARVLHVGGGSVGRWSPTNVFYMVRNHWPCLIASLPGPVLRARAGALLLAPLRAALLYAGRGRPLAALAGLLCGLGMLPAAYALRRRLARSGSSRKAAERIAALMADAYADRLLMKAAS